MNFKRHMTVLGVSLLALASLFVFGLSGTADATPKLDNVRSSVVYVQIVEDFNGGEIDYVGLRYREGTDITDVRHVTKYVLECKRQDLVDGVRVFETVTTIEIGDGRKTADVQNNDYSFALFGDRSHSGYYRIGDGSVITNGIEDFLICDIRGYDRFDRQVLWHQDTVRYGIR